MTTFYAAPDGENEPTVFLVNGDDPAVHPVIALFRRCDLPIGERLSVWPELVERLTGTGLFADLQRMGNAIEAQADVPGSLPWTVARTQEVADVWDDQPCGQCGHVRWMHDERGGCSDGFAGHDDCECVRFGGPQP